MISETSSFYLDYSEDGNCENEKLVGELKSRGENGEKRAFSLSEMLEEINSVKNFSLELYLLSSLVWDRVESIRAI